MANRYIGDNIRLLYDALMYADASNTPGMLFLVDFEKAFDSVSWSFIDNTLSFFGFGKDIRRWINIFHNDIKSCLIINGTLSPWFKIHRGCRQGEPISPYIFLLCAEILALMIRNNSDIKGLSINNQNLLMAQYADDTEFILDGSRKSFESTVNVLNKFADMSGLNINYNKSQVIWIGSKKDSKIRYLPNLKLEWNPKVFKILGIKFTTNIDEITNINFQNKLFEIKQIINRWMKRIITPLGRIAIIKSLLISKLNYLFLTLPNPPGDFLKELNQILFKFLWNNKPDRIKRTVACRPVSEGGLGMVDIFSYVKALKLIWIRKVCDISYIFKWKSLILSIFPNVNNLANFGCCYPIILAGKINNAFWKDCLNSFNMFAHKITCSTFDEFLTEPIFYNPNILIDKKPFYNSKWHQKGISQIIDFFSREGKFHTLSEIQEYFDIELSFVTYFGVIKAIKKYRKVLNVELTNSITLLDDTNVMRKLFSVKKGSKVYHYILSAKTNNIIKAESKWEELFHTNINWTNIYSKPFKLTQDTKLRWFQCRILHRIITTNIFLLKINKTESNRCTFCKVFPETILHLFWECISVKNFWNSFVQLMLDKCIHITHLTLNPELILLGETENTKTDNIFDFIILLAKFYIYKCKVLMVLPNITHFRYVLQNRYIIERNIYFSKCLYNKFQTKWAMYHNLCKT